MGRPHALTPPGSRLCVGGELRRRQTDSNSREGRGNTFRNRASTQLGSPTNAFRHMLLAFLREHL